MKQGTRSSVTSLEESRNQQSRNWLKLFISLLFCLVALNSLTLAQSWTTMPKLLGKRYDFGAATGPDGKVYVIGGVGDGIWGSSSLDSVEVFDPLALGWTPGPPMPGGKRGRLAVVTGVDGKIYAIGGQVGNQPTSIVERFNTKSGQWESVAGLNKARFLAAAAVGPDGRIYVIGGTNNNGTLKDAEVFDGTGWSVISATMVHPRERHTALTGLDGFIYVFGGDAGATVERFNGSQWELLPSFNSYRYSFASVTGPNGHLYTLGGTPPIFSGTGLVEDLLYDPYNPFAPVNWSYANLAPMPTPRGQLAAAVAEGSIFAIGGYSKALDKLDVVEAYGPISPPLFKDLRALWRFDQSDFWPPPGPGDDWSVNGNKGTPIGFPGYVGGRVWTAWPFNGSNFISVPDSPTLNFGTGDFSIEGWVKLNALQGGVAPIIEKRGGLSFCPRGYSLFLNNGKPALQLAVGCGASPAYANYVASNTLPVGEWIHLAVTVKRDESKGVKFYVNGVLTGEFAPLVGNIGDSNNPTGPLLIGKHAFWSTYFKGTLDEQAIYGRALNWAEVRAVFLAGGVGKF